MWESDDKSSDKLDTLLSAYLDNELPEADRQALEEALAADAPMRQRLELLRQANALAIAQAREIDAHPLPASLLRLLETPDATGKVLPFPQRTWQTMRQSAGSLALAASLVLAVGLALSVMQQRPDTGAGMPALATYMDLLETLPSGSQTRRDNYLFSPQFSFIGEDQAICRVYRLDSGTQGSGNIACRQQDAWELLESVALAPAIDAANYLPASGNLGEMDDLLDTLMQSSPLSLEQEARLMQQGWQQF